MSVRPFCLLLLIVLGACSLEAPAVAPVQADSLRPGDGIHITVTGEDELSGGFIVNSDGTVRLELLGPVPAAGLTPAAFQEDLRRRLAAGYLKAPQVAVTRIAPQAPPPLRPSGP